MPLVRERVFYPSSTQGLIHHNHTVLAKLTTALSTLIYSSSCCTSTLPLQSEDNSRESPHDSVPKGELSLSYSTRPIVSHYYNTEVIVRSTTTGNVLARHRASPQQHVWIYNSEPFSHSNNGIRHWSWNYRGC